MHLAKQYQSHPPVQKDILVSCKTAPRYSMQEILVTLGNRIRSLREQQGISQEAFADVCGLHRTAVGLIERGRSIPRLDTLLVISEHLGVAVSELLESQLHLRKRKMQENRTAFRSALTKFVATTERHRKCLSQLRFSRSLNFWISSMA
jgi:transcriptional regulator with XRE-family HTH domain